MKILCNRFLYAVYIANASQNPSYRRYMENVCALRDYHAIDHGGVQNGALISIGVDADMLQVVLTRGFKPESRRDVKVAEVTSESLTANHALLAAKVKQHFLIGKYYYPNLQTLQREMC